MKYIEKLSSKTEGPNKERSLDIHLDLPKSIPCQTKITRDISNVGINPENVKLHGDLLNSCSKCKGSVCKKVEESLLTLHKEIEFLNKENFHLKLLYFSCGKSRFFDDYIINTKKQHQDEKSV